MLRKSENNIIKLLSREIETNPGNNIKLERLNYFIDIISKKNKTMEEIKEINQFFEFDLETLGQAIASLISGYKNDHYESGFIKVDGPLETFDPSNPHLTIYDKPKPWSSVGMYVIMNRTFKNGFILNDSEKKRKERIFYLSGPYTLAYLEDIKNINWETNKAQNIDITIFEYDFYSKGKFSMKLKQFETLPDYVQRFIEYLIGFKMSNGILTIPSDKLEKLIAKFLEEFKKYKARKIKGAAQAGYDFSEEDLAILNEESKETMDAFGEYDNPAFGELIDLPDLYLSGEERKAVYEKTIGKVLRNLEPKQKNDIN